MENRAYAIAVGIFTLVLGIGLVFAYWWISGSQQARTAYTVSSQLPVTGLSPEAAVKFRGVDVGKVIDISIDPSSQTTVMINIAVAQNLKLTSEAYAELRRQGLTGLAYIDLNDESINLTALPASSIIPLRPTLVDELMSKGPELTAQLETLLRNSSKFTASANQFLTKIDIQKLNNTIENFEKASEKALPAIDSATNMFNNANKMVSDKNQVQLAQTLETMQQTFDATKPLIDELSLTAKKFHHTTDQFEISTNQVANTLSNETLPQLHALTQNMNRSTIRFNQLIDVLQDNPQSILFGKPALPAGPGEEGFTDKP
ncbi:MlaD family protein [Methylotenera sp.]|uniref:MlaD family protein n=1 Tax=Methylotenera sp. TaxID=2051956 RepID=UPI0027319C5D|nr:MlaD family protein [Methylotenera sp.]MDP2231072.1 MlaD family protein [Methylotenera sp.]MDP3141279.1 MlaD family protein [Methylotenera sp.]